MFHFGEELSEILNLVLKNGYLEDVSIQVKIPNLGVLIMEEIHEEASSDINLINASTLLSTNYPNVKKMAILYN